MLKELVAQYPVAFICVAACIVVCLLATLVALYAAGKKARACESDNKTKGALLSDCLNKLSESGVRLGHVEASLSSVRAENEHMSCELASAKALLSQRDATLRVYEDSLEKCRTDNLEFREKSERLSVECCALRLREDIVMQWQTRGIIMTPEFAEALRAIFDPNDHSPIYISGPAGTGKSVLIGLIRSNLRAGCAVVAPFGLAANNVGGQTIHSLFKFPPVYKPRSGLLSSDQGVKLLKAMKVLVIDEASTLSAHLADAIDATLREGRGINAPFGGCLLVLVGDLAQLPPVYDTDDRDRNQERYGSPEPFFFDAHVFKKTPIRRKFLTHIFRQMNIPFTDTLSRIRTGCHSENDIAYLNLRHKYADLRKPLLHRTTVYPINSNVNALNDTCLATIQATLYTFKAEIVGDVTLSQIKNGKYPPELRVKKGARVMILDNAGQSYSNGTIGTVTSIDPENKVIRVCTTNGEFSISPSEQKIMATTLAGEELITEEKGKIIQYPLQLAWAVTVHKAQGQTFEEAYIDPSGTFTHGQVYVALSRVKEPDRLHLLSPLGTHHVMTNQTLKRDGWL